MARHFDVASWPTTLKVSSALGTVLLAGLTYAAYRAVPTSAGFSHVFGLVVTAILPAIVAFSLLFVVKGYAVDHRELHVKRLLWSTCIPLAGLKRIWHEPAACKGSRRVFGNGGLFSFTGFYYSKALGRHRLFATDLSHAVVLAFPRRAVVVTPASPVAFVEQLHSLFPLSNTGSSNSTT